jgi:hypothetical protein
VVKKKLLKLDLSYADRAKLLHFPWQWQDGSVEEFKCAEVFQYVPGRKRLPFMEELYRVLAPEGKATILTAYYASAMAFADYELEWPPVCEQSFLFFNKKWRETNNITAPIKCDFEFGYGFAWSPEVAARSTEVQAEFLKSRLNVAQKLQVVLTKAKPS